MGTAIKTIAMSLVVVWLLLMIGCSMLASTVTHRSKSHAGASADTAGAARQRALEARSAREFEAGGGSAATVETPEDRLVRAIIVARAARDLNGSSGGSYSDNAAGERPHFKPGEPMIDPSVDRDD